MSDSIEQIYLGDMDMSIYHGDMDMSIYRLKLKPILDGSANMCHLRKTEELSQNENFASYRVMGDIPMRGILYIDSAPSENEIKKLGSSYEPHFITETYADHIEKLENLEESHTAWIQKIIDGVTELDKMIERNDEFIIIRDWKFDIEYDSEGNGTYRKTDLHLLGIPNNKIESLRDIDIAHIPMLERIKEQLLKTSEQVFGLKQDEVKLYFHYPPTTYHLHIHCTWTGLSDSTVNFERAYDFDSVIKNIQLDQNYYKREMRYVVYHR